MEAIRLLKMDHNRVKQLFKRYEALGEKAEQGKQELFETIQAELDVHARIEEEIFYPAVKEARTKVGQELVAEGIEEHLLIKRLLSELSRMKPADEQFDAKMTVLRELTVHHIGEEEEAHDGTFAIARTKISRDRLMELGELMEARKDALQAGWIGAAQAWLKSLVPGM